MTTGSAAPNSATPASFMRSRSPWRTLGRAGWLLMLPLIALTLVLPSVLAAPAATGALPAGAPAAAGPGGVDLGVGQQLTGCIGTRSSSRRGDVGYVVGGPDWNGPDNGAGIASFAKTTDGGKTWSRSRSPVPRAGYAV